MVEQRWAIIAAVALVSITVLVVGAVYGFDWLKPSKEDALSLTGSAIADRAFFYDDISASAACADFVDPVCGSDGVSYENACKAVAAGAEIRYRGACR